MAGSHSFARVGSRNRTDEPPLSEGFDFFARVKCRDGETFEIFLGEGSEGLDWDGDYGHPIGEV